MKAVNPHRFKTKEEIAAEVASQDTGYCNPMKLKLAQENATDAVEELRERGYSEGEIAAILSDD